MRPDPVFWTLVIPIKHAARAKSRLGATPRLSRAIARDTVLAAASATRVAEIVIVTNDPDHTVWADVPRVRVHMDPPGDVFEHTRDGDDALNNAIRAGLTTTAGPTAVLAGDLPALHPAALDAALDAASRVPRGVVPDADGAGTTLLTALETALLIPRFGRGSFERHRSHGHVALDVDPTLRRDIDTPDHLAELLASAAPATHTRAATGA